MGRLEQIVRHERHEQRLGYVVTLALFAVVALIVAAYIRYL